MSTKLPTAEAVLEWAKTNGWKLEPGCFCDRESRTCCFAGALALMARLDLADRDNWTDSDVENATGLYEAGIQGGIDGFDGELPFGEHSHRALYRRMYAEGRKLRMLVEPDAFGPVEAVK